jgi:hypothetical protein
MVTELGEYDILRQKYEDVSTQLNYCKEHDSLMVIYYQDTLIKLSKQLVYYKEFAEIQTDNVNNAEAQLFNKKNGNESLRKQRNAWRVIAGVTIVIATLININND